MPVLHHVRSLQAVFSQQGLHINSAIVHSSAHRFLGTLLLTIAMTLIEEMHTYLSHLYGK
jgi:hypothetical protein